jgi:hypothetical protein
MKKIKTLVSIGLVSASLLGLVACSEKMPQGDFPESDTTTMVAETTIESTTDVEASMFYRAAYDRLMQKLSERPKIEPNHLIKCGNRRI